VVIDLEEGRLRAATAGHYPPLLCSDEGDVRPLAMEPQIVLGVDATAEYPTEDFELPAGADLLLYTDGVLDVEGPGGERFGKQGLREALAAGRHDSAQAMVDSVLARINSFRGAVDLPDDLTLVGIQLAPEPMSVAQAARL
jgi:serine phosphatase RsbU (regulator of sigma subunit)